MGEHTTMITKQQKKEALDYIKEIREEVEYMDKAFIDFKLETLEEIIKEF